METWLHDIFGWLPTGWSYYALVGLISFFESLALLGIFVPGSVLVVFAGFLAAHGKGDYALLVAVSAFGAVAGDLVSYFLGARMGPVLANMKIFRKRVALLRKSELFFLAHGGKSLLFARFVGFLRPFIPFVAGSARMRPLPVLLYALLGGLLWGLAYPGLGYFFGASWQKVQLWSGRFSFFIVTAVALFFLDAFFWKWCVPRFSRLWSRLRSRCGERWRKLLESRPAAAFIAKHPRLWNFFAERFTLRRGSGLYLTVGFCFSSLFAVAFLLLARGIRLDSAVIDLDRRIHALVQHMHHPLSDSIFLALTFLGNAPVLAMASGLCLLWLILRNRDFSAVILLAGCAGGSLMIVLLKELFSRPRPAPFIHELLPASASFPSAHAFLSLTVYGLAVYMILGTVAVWRSRFTLILSGTFFALLIGFSRIYLGLHWFSDVLAGFALGALWLSFLVTASEVRRRYGGEFPWKPGVQLVRLSSGNRILILSMATLAVAVSVLFYILSQLEKYSR